MANDLGLEVIEGNKRPRRGHPALSGPCWRRCKGGGTVERTRAIDVMRLARAGYLAGLQFGTWQWSYANQRPMERRGRAMGR
jgi:hypothetical protein